MLFTLPRKSIGPWTLALSCLLIVFTGCSTTRPRLAIDDLKPIQTLKVVRVEAPDLIRRTSDQSLPLVGQMVLGPVGAAIGGMMKDELDHQAGVQLQKDCNLPDLGELVLNHMKQRLAQEIPQWPAMEFQDAAVPKGYKSPEYLLLLQITGQFVSNDIGYCAGIQASLRNPQNKLIWQKIFGYESKWFQRYAKLEDLEADNGKLLHDEYAYAADLATSSFIVDLNRQISPDAPPLYQQTPLPDSAGHNITVTFANKTMEVRAHIMISTVERDSVYFMNSEWKRDLKGVTSFGDLTPGWYDISVSYQYFNEKKYARKKIKIEKNQRTDIELSFNIGGEDMSQLDFRFSKGTIKWRISRRASESPNRTTATANGKL